MLRPLCRKVIMIGAMVLHYGISLLDTDAARCVPTSMRGVIGALFISVIPHFIPCIGASPAGRILGR